MIKSYNMFSFSENKNLTFSPDQIRTSAGNIRGAAPEPTETCQLVPATVSAPSDNQNAHTYPKHTPKLYITTCKTASYMATLNATSIPTQTENIFSRSRGLCSFLSAVAKNGLILLLLSMAVVQGWGQTNNYFGTSGTLSGNVWSTNPAGPYTSALVTTGGPILNFNNIGSATGATISTVVGINFGAAITWTAGGTIGAAGINLPINVSTGIEQDFGSSQAFSTSATASFTKNGDGSLAMGGGTFGGGFTLNAGTLIARGVNAMGGNATPGPLTINGGTIAANATRDFTGKYSGITIGGNFTLGATTGLASSTANLTFSNDMSLGSSTSRTITIGGTGTYTLGGIISGANSNLTVGATAVGTIVLTGANTYSGLTTVNGGTLRLNRSGGTTIPATNDVVVNNGGTLRISTTQTLNNVTVNAGGTLIVDAGITLTINGTYSVSSNTSGNAGTIAMGPNSILQINQGGWPGNTGTFTYNASATLQFSNTSGSYGVNSTDPWWPTSNGPANVNVSGAGGITMNVARTVSGLLQTSAGITNANNLTINGTLQLNSGGFLTGSPVYGNASLLRYNTTGTYGRGAEWSATGIGTIGTTAGYPNDVQVSNNTTLNLPNGSNTDRACARDLTVDSGSALFADFGMGSVRLTVGRNFSMAGNVSLGSAAGGDLYVKGNFTRSAGVFTPNSRAVFFDAASGDQTITGSTTFAFMIVDKAAGNVVLNNDITCTQTLTLTNGRIQTGSNKVILTASGTISRTNGYIFGNLQRRVTTGLSLFPVGSASVYAPVTLNMAGVSGDVDITGFTTLGDHPNQATSPIDPAKKANHYWTFTKSGAGTFTSYTGEFSLANTTNGGTLANYRIAKFDSPSTWSAAGGSTSGALVTSATFSSFSDFVAGEENTCVPVSALSYSSNPAVYCKDAAITDNTPTITGDTPITWSVSPALPAGLNLNASTGVISGTPTVAAAMATYTVTAMNACGTATADVVITVNAGPSAVTAGSNSPVCIGSNLNLTSSASGTEPLSFSWTGPDSFSSTNQNPTITAVTSVNAGTYTVTVTNSCGNATSSVAVTVVDPTTTISYGPNHHICDHSSYPVTINGLTGGTFTASPSGLNINASTGLIDANSTHNAYTVSYTVAATAGCPQVVATTNVFISKPNPSAGTVNGTTPLIVSQTATYSSTGDAGGEWSSTNTSVASINPVTGLVTALSPGTTDITYSIGCNNPQATAFKTLTVIASCDPTHTPTASSNGPICAGQNLNLMSGAMGTAPFTYSWTGPNSFTSMDQNPTITAASAAASGTYHVTITNACGSTNTSVVVVVNARPTATTCRSNDPCQAGAGEIIVNVSGGMAPYSVGCSGVFTAPHPNAPNAVTGITTPVTVNANPGMATFSGLPGNASYIITVTDANNCTPE